MNYHYMGLLPDKQNYRVCMRRECRERFSRHLSQRKPVVSDLGMHRGTCVTHVPWCMSRPLTRGGGENVPGIPGACATRNFAYPVRIALLAMSLFVIVWFASTPLSNVKISSCKFHHILGESLNAKPYFLRLPVQKCLWHPAIPQWHL